MESSQAPSSGIWAAIKGSLGIFDNINKSSYVSEESSPFPMGDFESSLSDQEIIELSDTWKQRYAPYYHEVEKSQRIAFKYWIGQQDTSDIQQWQGSMPAIDNLIFEAVETFLPIATKAVADPVVSADPSPAGQALAKDLRNALLFEADRQKIRLLVKRVLRHWLIYRIGAVKFVWNPVTNQIETCAVNPKRMIFDTDGYVDVDSTFKGEFFGEKMREPAHKVLEKFKPFLTPEKKQYILQKANHKLGTMIEYIEWWYQGTDNFYTLDQIVLGKFKNHMWNYDGTEERPDPITGEPMEVDMQGQNFLLSPSAPYRFLSIFSTGIQPHDETSLIMQNVGIQDLINRRWRQIDQNVSRMNNSLVVNGRSFTDEQASLAATAMRDGRAIRVPNPAGSNLESDVMNVPAPALTASVFENLQDARSELKNLFGTAGSSSAGVAAQETARGQILSNQLDSSRIGGGVGEYLEQFEEAIYNYWTQIMFVYYDAPHYMTVSGVAGGKELAMLSSARLGLSETLSITVKEGSLVPKDPLTKRNEAIQLWGAGAIDPRMLFDRLEYADPNEAAKQLILWQLFQKGDMQALQMYMPDLAQQAPFLPSLQQQPMQPGGQPGQPQPGAAQPQGQAVNPPGRPPNPAGQQGFTPPPVAAESKELMQSVPIGGQ